MKTSNDTVVTSSSSSTIQADMFGEYLRNGTVSSAHTNPLLDTIFKSSDVSQEEKHALVDALLALTGLGCTDFQIGSIERPASYKHHWQIRVELPPPYAHLGDPVIGVGLAVTAQAATLCEAVHEVLLLLQLYVASKAISTPAY